MIRKFSYKSIDWIDLESPNVEDIEHIKNAYGIHPIVGSELHAPTLKPKVDLYENHIFIILHFPIFNKKESKVVNQEVDFIIGKNFLITTHYEIIKPLHELPEIFEFESLLEKDTKAVHAGFLFFYIIRHLYESLEEGLNLINIELETAEEEIFKGNEREMVVFLSRVGRHLLDFRKSIKTHSDILTSFERASKTFFESDFGYYATSISGEYYKIWNMAESSTDMFRELRETNDSLLSTKINDIMKFLTIMAFATFPLTLIAGIFGMNTDNTPIIGHALDFWLIIVIMMCLTLSFFAFFKYKKWL